MRVAFVLRSVEVQPLFRDLCKAAGPSFGAMHLANPPTPCACLPLGLPSLSWSSLFVSASAGCLPIWVLLVCWNSPTAFFGCPWHPGLECLLLFLGHHVRTTTAGFLPSECALAAQVTCSSPFPKETAGLHQYHGHTLPGFNVTIHCRVSTSQFTAGFLRHIHCRVSSHTLPGLVTYTAGFSTSGFRRHQATQGTNSNNPSLLCSALGPIHPHLISLALCLSY